MKLNKINKRSRYKRIIRGKTMTYLNSILNSSEYLEDTKLRLINKPKLALEVTKRKFDKHGNESIEWNFISIDESELDNEHLNLLLKHIGHN